MRLIFALSLLVCLLAPAIGWSAPQNQIGDSQSEPLSELDLLHGLAQGISNARMVTLVNKFGVNFALTAEVEGRLRAVGAQDELIAAIREAQPRSKPFSEYELLQALARGAKSSRLTRLVNVAGVDFVPSSESDARLRAVGAEDDLINAIHAARPARTGGPPTVNATDGLTYVWIPPGTFLMGCSPGDSDCADDEKPAHDVTIARGFWMGQTDVTVAAYKRFAAATSHAMPSAPGFNPNWQTDDQPVVNVTWEDSSAYCRWAGGRLPTEAEWEYAARGGATTARYGELDAIAWYDSNANNQAHPVAHKQPNAFGLYDMLGNVWQWIGDWYGANYYAQSPAQDPTGPPSGPQRVVRGGSCSSGAAKIRASNRLLATLTLAYDNGFRCVHP